MKPTHCRIFGIMAREAPVCVIFRRGPSKWTQLVKWDTKRDRFDSGSWFHGRIYERESDLSPDGNYLIYFAVNFARRWDVDKDGYTFAWTAISHPPRYTAVMLWPKGNCAYGGGLFSSNRDVMLNHRPEEAKVHPRHNTDLFNVHPDANPSWGELYRIRIERDGWVCVHGGEILDICQKNAAERSETWEKAAESFTLRRELFSRRGVSCFEVFSLIMKNGNILPLTGAGWAELDQAGELVFARRGKLWRGMIVKSTLREKELINLDLNQPRK